MKYRALQMAGVLALLAVVGKFYAVPAYAQIKATFIQNRDEPGRNAYYQTASCNINTFGYCSVTFPVVPAGKRLVLTHVSALNLMPAANTITSSDLRILNGNIKAFYPVTQYPSTAPGVNYVSNDNAPLTFEAGETPQFLTFVSSNANFQLVVSLSGYTVDLP